jgi:hypothetical protein
VKYISIRSDEALCSGQYTGGDGVHLNFAGYSIMWNKARAVAGLPDNEDKPVKVATARRKPAGNVATDKPATAFRYASATDQPRQHRRKNEPARAEQDFSPLGSFFSIFRRGY